MLEIPLTARLTSPVALELLQPALSAAGMPTAGGLAEEDQLALAVAYLKVQGDASPWHPYIASLPAAPPCGWSKGGGQLAGDFDRCLHRHGVDLQWWQFFVGQVGAAQWGRGEWGGGQGGGGEGRAGKGGKGGFWGLLGTEEGQ